MAVGLPEGDPRRAREPKALFLTGVTPSNALDQIGRRRPLPSAAAGGSPIDDLIAQWLEGWPDDHEEHLRNVRARVFWSASSKSVAPSDMSSDIAVAEWANGCKRKQAPAKIGRR